MTEVAQEEELVGVAAALAVALAAAVVEPVVALLEVAVAPAEA